MAILSQRALDYIADNIERYLDAHAVAVILEGSSAKEYRKGVELTKKTLKKLRDGKCNSKIFDMESLEANVDMIEKEAASRH